MGVVALVVAWQLGRPDPRIDDDDFGVFYRGAAALAAGRSAYVGDFVSPPWFALMLAPLTLLPLEIARGVWLGANLALLVGTTRLSARLAGLRWPLRRVLLAAALFALWPPIEFGLTLGQNSLLTWALVLVGVRLAASDRWGAAGAALALSLVKPQLAILFVVGIGVRASAVGALGRWLTVGTAVLGGLALMILLASPSSYADVLELTPRPWNYWGSTVGLPPLVAWVSGSHALGILLWLPVGLVGSGLVLRAWTPGGWWGTGGALAERTTAPESGGHGIGHGLGDDERCTELGFAAALTASATLLLTPYAYPYDAVLLQLPVFWLAAWAARRWTAACGAVAVIGVLGVVVLWIVERPGDYTPWRFLGLLAPLGLLVALLAVRYSSPRARGDS